MVTCEVEFTRSHKSDLHTLKEVQLLESWPGIRHDYSRALAGTYFCKLVEMVSEWETPIGGVHEILQLSLTYLNDHAPSMKLLERFEDRLCLELGHGTVDVGRGGVVLQEIFHRSLPPQRAELLSEWKRKLNP